MEKRLPLPVGTVLQGRYRILRQLGHGGFGAVYEAVDDEINLTFALKETFFAANEELRQLFKREAKMLATLSHDAFPRISHYFTENDGCFLVMELVRGDDLDKLLTRQNAPFEQSKVLDWADQILDALEDLHESGIIHRDIKPSNLKLTPKGKIKLLDFGIAKGKLEGETNLLTGSMAAATPQYAPLEQILKASEQYQLMLSAVSSEKVVESMRQRTDAASDLYALAATLYHLLTKKLPADAPTRALTIWTGKPDPLIPAHQINPHIQKEVSDILQNALNLDRQDRYKTAEEMRQMLKEAVKSTPLPKIEPSPNEPSPFANDDIPPPTQPSPKPFNSEPKPFSAFEMPQSASKPKNKLPLYLLLLASPILLIVGLIIYFNKFANGVQSNTANSNAANTVKANTALANSNLNSSNTNSNTATAPSSIYEQYELVQTLTGHSSFVNSVAFSPDGNTIASAGDDKTIKLWDVQTGTLKQTLTGHSNYVNSVAFSLDDKTIVSGGHDNSVKIWDASTGTLKQTLREKGGNYVFSIALSPDGKTLVCGKDDAIIQIWDLSNGILKQTLNGNSDYNVYSVAFSPDGKTFASGFNVGIIKIWDASTGTLKQTLAERTRLGKPVVFSPDGKMLAGGFVNNITISDLSNGTLIQTLSGKSGYVISIAFSPDGKLIASGSEDKTVKLWNVATGLLKQTLTGHSEKVTSIAFSPDGRTIASGSWDKTIKLWRLKE